MFESLLLVIIWSIKYINRKRGPLVFLLLSIMLIVFGGGIGAPVLIYPAAGIAATRINKPLHWWQKALPYKIRPMLARLWPYTLGIALSSMMIGLYIAITGHIPFGSNLHPDTVLAICLGFVFGGGLGMFLISFVCGFAADIENNPR